METENKGFWERPVDFPFSISVNMDESDAPGTVTADSSYDSEDTRNKAAELVEVAEHYRAKLVWMATRITNRREEAEDIVQQALMKAFSNLSKFRGDAKMRTWLTSIVQNTARDYARTNRGRTFVPLECDPFRDGNLEEFDLRDPAMDPEERFERWERVEILYAAIRGLSESNQSLLRMCVFDEVPYERVASRLNTRVSTIKSRVFRGKHQLSLAIGGDMGGG
jgi:RNA polymerase sigma-70 factor (ECF subfamily)